MPNLPKRSSGKKHRPISICLKWFHSTSFLHKVIQVKQKHPTDVAFRFKSRLLHPEWRQKVAVTQEPTGLEGVCGFQQTPPVKRLMSNMCGCKGVQGAAQPRPQVSSVWSHWEPNNASLWLSPLVLSWVVFFFCRGETRFPFHWRRRRRKKKGEVKSSVRKASDMKRQRNSPLATSCCLHITVTNLVTSLHTKEFCVQHSWNSPSGQNSADRVAF